MKCNIRAYKQSDFSAICDWVGETLPHNMLVENGTFILELNGVPSLCITVLLTQSLSMSYLFGFIKNPIFKGVNLEEWGQMLWNHCFNWAREKGYTQIICFSEREKLSEKYCRFGMTKTADVSGFIKFL